MHVGTFVVAPAWAVFSTTIQLFFDEESVFPMYE